MAAPNGINTVNPEYKGVLYVPLYTPAFSANTVFVAGGLDQNSIVPTVISAYGGNNTNYTIPGIIGIQGQSYYGETYAVHNDGATIGGGFTTSNMMHPVYNGGELYSVLFGEQPGAWGTSEWVYSVACYFSTEPYSDAVSIPMTTQSISFPSDLSFYAPSFSLAGTRTMNCGRINFNTDPTSNNSYVVLDNCIAFPIDGGADNTFGLYFINNFYNWSGIYLTTFPTGGSLMAGQPGQTMNGVDCGMALMFLPPLSPKVGLPTRPYIMSLTGADISTIETTYNILSPYTMWYAVDCPGAGGIPTIGYAVPMTNVENIGLEDNAFVPIFNADAPLDAEFAAMNTSTCVVNVASKGWCFKMPSGRYILLDKFCGWYAEIKFVAQDVNATKVMDLPVNWTIDEAGIFYLYGSQAPYLVNSFGWDFILSATNLNLTVPNLSTPCLPCTPVAYGRS